MKNTKTINPTKLKHKIWDADLTIRAVAYELNMSDGTISNICSGRKKSVSERTMYKLCKLFDCKEIDLM